MDQEVFDNDTVPAIEFVQLEEEDLVPVEQEPELVALESVQEIVSVEPCQGIITFLPGDKIFRLEPIEVARQEMISLEPVGQQIPKLGQGQEIIAYDNEPSGQIAKMEESQEIVLLENVEEILALEPGKEIISFDLVPQIEMVEDLNDPLSMNPPKLQQTQQMLALNISKKLRKDPKIKEIKLKPVPIATAKPTRRRNSVPESVKDEKYYERCAKNAIATKRTRQIQRTQMEQLIKRHDFLKVACAELKVKIQQVKQGQIVNSTTTTTTTTTDNNNGDSDGLSKEILKLERIWNQLKKDK